MFFRQITDEDLAQRAYLLGCEETGKALLVDPERDIDRYVQLAEENDLEIEAVAETHIHADFLAGTREFAEHHDVTVYLSGEGDEGASYNWPQDGEYKVEQLTDGDTFNVGSVQVKVLHTPGHTPEHLSFLATDQESEDPASGALLTGDFVFAGSLGRPDLQKTLGSTLESAAKKLYQSAERFLDLPDDLPVWPGHGAGTACGKELNDKPSTTVGDEKQSNALLQKVREGKEAFVDDILGNQPETPRYFGRMKKLNKKGPPLLGHLAEPRRLAASQLEYMAGKQNLAVVDTRDRDTFVEGHLLASIHAPLGQQFHRMAGSYLTPNMPVYLIIEEEQVHDTLLALIRIGLDNVTGYATPDVLERYGEENRLEKTDEITFEDLEKQRKENNVVVLDVRGTNEYEAGHVPGALNIPYTDLLDHRHDIAMDQTVLVHCQRGVRSAAASALLERFGYNVRYVNDDFENWAKAYGR